MFETLIQKIRNVSFWKDRVVELDDGFAVLICNKGYLDKKYPNESYPYWQSHKFARKFCKFSNYQDAELLLKAYKQ